VSSHLKAGRLRALALTSMRRSAVSVRRADDERNLFRFRVRAWVGLLAPGRTRREIVAPSMPKARRFSICPTPGLASPSWVGERTGLTRDLDRWIRAEMERWGR